MDANELLTKYAQGQRDFRNADLSLEDLTGADLSGIILLSADLSDVNLSRAILAKANLQSTMLIETDLSGADLSSANLTNANLSGANLDRANLSSADLTNANLSGANLDRANLSCANLTQTNLSSVSLCSANLEKANLLRANLSRANLDGANLTRAKLISANLFLASFEDADFNHAKLPDGEIYKPNTSDKKIGKSSASLQKPISKTPKIIRTEQAPTPVGPYNQAVVASGSMIFIAGQIAIDPRINDIVYTDDVAKQTEQVMAHIEAILTAAGATFQNVVKTTVFLANMNDFAAMNEVYARYFDESTAPARACVQVSRLPKDVLVEIDCIAAI